MKNLLPAHIVTKGSTILQLNINSFQSRPFSFVLVGAGMLAKISQDSVLVRQTVKRPRLARVSPSCHVSAGHVIVRSGWIEAKPCKILEKRRICIRCLKLDVLNNVGISEEIQRTSMQP